MLNGKQNLVKLGLIFTLFFGVFLLVAWASFSPLDNAWTVASSATHSVLNKTGIVGAWLTDLGLAMFGKMAVIFPLALISSAIYQLFFNQAENLNCRKVWLWLSSLTLLMLGLAGLASVLLSPSPYYLAGGFFGGLLNELFGGWIGQAGVLLVAALFSCVGFYFCSGQILWQWLGRVYHWIFENKNEVPEQTVSDNLQNFAENSPLVEPSEMGEAEQEHNQLTDVRHFTRPKITGLRNETQSEQPELFEQADFAVEQEIELPTVRVDETYESLSVNNSPKIDQELTFEYVDDSKESVMPTVRLNTPVENAILPQQQQDEPAVSMTENIEPLPEPELPEISLPDDPLFVPPEIETPAFMQPSSAAVTRPMTPLPEKKASYPKGYGDSLIHPLLQKKTVLEKPTTPLPTLDLLTAQPVQTPPITEQEIVETSARIEQELANFGVRATVEDVLVGPVVTRYEIQPAPGVKASKITNLDTDLARALIFEAIRITNVVPGKPYMGIETPNKYRETVWLRDVLDSDAFRHSNATLPMALGKDISGEPVVVDMAKMPHLLVAGQTGGGKSVGVNTMILSLLYKLTPEQVRFIMIDPKVVELSIYNDIPHLLTPVVTDMKKAENALRWAVEEMERRYLLVSSLSVRNIEGYNDKIRQAKEMGIPIPNTLWRPGDTMDTLPPPLEKMSYIVLIVDEFADLMMSAGKQVEDHIMRIAQKARAVGIHLILATQRPSTDVITGVIKANIPSRIAFTVASQIDSRTILDKGGAESLLGRGDMLYSASGSPDIIRVHGAFMTDDDVQKVADNWRARGKPEYIDSIVESSDDSENSNAERVGSGGELDPLFDEIAQFMIDGGATSISGIQRRFSLGFNRAARIIDQLEEEGILSAPDSRGKREVLAR